MPITTMLNNPRLDVSPDAPYDPLQAFVRENHIALQGSGVGPLAGLKFAIKDVWKVIGSTCGNGHPEWLRTHAADEFTSSIVTKLLNAGGDLVGKTVCDELCFSISGENWNYGSPINPHDPRRYTGGSSCGSAAAAAGGLVDFSLGSDCLGSVRVPASYNGLLALRPTFGRVPGDGEAPYCASMDVVGFMSACPDTFDRLAPVMLEEDEAPANFKRLVIAEDCFRAVNADVAEALQPAVDHMRGYFDEVDTVTVAPEGLAEWIDVFRIIQGYQVWESYGGWIRKYRPRLSRGPKERLEWASTITLQQFNEASAKRRDICARIDEVLPAGSVMVLPTAASVAPLRTASLEEISATRLQSTNLLCISPLTGVPQLQLPMIKQYEVPLGISLLSPKGTDLALCRLGAQMVRDFNK